MSKKRIALLMAVVMVLGVAVGSTMAWLTDDTTPVVNTFTVGDINIKLQEHKLNEDGETLATGEGSLIPAGEQDGNNYLFVPGDTLPKDPFVTVEKDSEANYLFVKVVVANNSCTDNSVTPAVTSNPIIDFDIADGWTFYAAEEGQTTPTSFVNGTYYFYRTVSKNSTNDQIFDVIKGKHESDCNQGEECDCKFVNGFVTVDTKVTKGMVNTINDSTNGGKAKPSVEFTAYAVQADNIADTEANKPAEAFKILFGTNP